MTVIVARSAGGAAAFAARLAGRGVPAVAAPVLRIAPIPGAETRAALAGARAILLTSANGARALAAADAPRETPIVAVGDATAARARALGFADVRSANGDAAALAAFAAARLDPADGPLVHVSGRDAAGDLAGALRARGFACRRAVLYEAVAVGALPAAAERVLRAGGARAAALFSARGAQTLAALARRAGLAGRLRSIDAWCLSAAVAEAARPAGWRRVIAAPRPRAAALLDMLAAARGGAAP